MKRTFALLVITAAFLACTKTAPVVVVQPPAKKAIDIAYVAVPFLKVYDAPRAGATQVTQYGINETVSILAKRGEWCEVRTIDGSGWALASELMDAGKAKQIADDPTPRFLVPVTVVPDARARGEIALVAKVNTDGEVVEVKIGKNSTNNNALAAANANALMQAKFYPMVQKGQRMTFFYEHKVAY